MVRLSAVVGLLLTMAIGTQAANTYCQCLYSDGSHCCVIVNENDCTTTCSKPGLAPIFEDDRPCNAGGKNSKVSFFNAQGRHACNQ